MSKQCSTENTSSVSCVTEDDSSAGNPDISGDIILRTWDALLLPCTDRWKPGSLEQWQQRRSPVMHKQNPRRRAEEPPFQKIKNKDFNAPSLRVSRNVYSCCSPRRHGFSKACIVARKDPLGAGRRCCCKRRRGGAVGCSWRTMVTAVSARSRSRRPPRLALV